MLCSVLSFSLSPLFLWVFFCCAFFKKWSSWFAQNSYCILKVALFLSLSRYSMGQERDQHTFCIYWSFPTILDALNEEVIHFAIPAIILLLFDHFLLVAIQFFLTEYIPYWFIVISFMLWYPENPCLIILAPFLPQQSPFLFLPPNNPGMRQNSLLLKFLLT